jgi:hypothetical protein
MKSQITDTFLLLTQFHSVCGILNATLYSIHYRTYGPKLVDLELGWAAVRGKL